MVRVGGYQDRAGIQQALDCGADGILIPYINTAAEAKEGISCCKYPTTGTRSVYFPQRATNKKGLLGYVGNANDNVIVALQVRRITHPCRRLPPPPASRRLRQAAQRSTRPLRPAPRVLLPRHARTGVYRRLAATPPRRNRWRRQTASPTWRRSLRCQGSTSSSSGRTTCACLWAFSRASTCSRRCTSPRS